MFYILFALISDDMTSYVFFFIIHPRTLSRWNILSQQEQFEQMDTSESTLQRSHASRKNRRSQTNLYRNTQHIEMSCEINLNSYDFSTRVLTAGAVAVAACTRYRPLPLSPRQTVVAGSVAQKCVVVAFKAALHATTTVCVPDIANCVGPVDVPSVNPKLAIVNGPPPLLTSAGSKLIGITLACGNALLANITTAKSFS